MQVTAAGPIPTSHPTSFASGEGVAGDVLLATRGLACERGERRLFEGLDLRLLAGGITWLKGRNGRGKTSLLRQLAGLSSPAAGTIEVLGRPQAQAGPAWRRHWVYLAHQNALKDDLSASEALRFLALLQGWDADAESVLAALRRMGIANRQHAPVRTLSQGQRRRVALARLALAQSSGPQARIWLLDEPFDALDSDGISDLNALLIDHARSGGCVLLTSHQALSLTDTPVQTLDLETYAPPLRRSA